MHHIADRITSRRTVLGLSVARLAEQAGIPRMTLSRRLVAPATFTVGELERIASVLGVSIEDLTTASAA